MVGANRKKNSGYSIRDFDNSIIEMKKFIDVQLDEEDD